MGSFKITLSFIITIFVTNLFGQTNVANVALFSKTNWLQKDTSSTGLISKMGNNTYKLSINKNNTWGFIVNDSVNQKLGKWDIVLEKFIMLFNQKNNYGQGAEIIELTDSTLTIKYDDKEYNERKIQLKSVNENIIKQK